MDVSTAGVAFDFRGFAADRRSRRDLGKRELHTLGLHGFGLVGQSGFDYDFNFAFQFGRNEGLSHSAFAMHTEVGYTIDHESQPRFAVWVNYASGDRDPFDDRSQRFDRLYGASHTMYGYSDLFVWENMINPAFYFSIRPAATPNIRLEAFYRAYWLAAKADAWVVPGIADSTGESGSFIGQGIDMRLRYQINRNAGVMVGYAHFMPGTFVTRALPNADDSDFFYVAMTVRF